MNKISNDNFNGLCNEKYCNKKYTHIFTLYLFKKEFILPLCSKHYYSLLNKNYKEC